MFIHMFRCFQVGGNTHISNLHLHNISSQPTFTMILITVLWFYFSLHRLRTFWVMLILHCLFIRSNGIRHRRWNCSSAMVVPGTALTTSSFWELLQIPRKLHPRPIRIYTNLFDSARINLKSQPSNKTCASRYRALLRHRRHLALPWAVGQVRLAPELQQS